MVRLIPFFILSEHCIQDGQQFAHTGNQRYFFGFSCCNQPGIKRFNNWIVAGCYECGHVQRSSHTRPTTKDGSSASHRARIPVYWGNAHESANFSSRETTQFRNLGQQCGYGHGTDALNATQSLREFFEVSSDMVIHIIIDPHKLVFQRFDDGINAFSALRGSKVQPVSLSNQHSDQLPSANYHCIENLTFYIRQSPDKTAAFRMAIDNLSHLRKYSRGRSSPDIP